MKKITDMLQIARTAVDQTKGIVQQVTDLGAEVVGMIRDTANKVKPKKKEEKEENEEEPE